MRLHHSSYQVMGLIFFFHLNMSWPCDLLCPVKCGGKDTVGFPTLYFKSFVAAILTFLKSSILECYLRPPGSGKAQASSMGSPCGGKLGQPG